MRIWTLHPKYLDSAGLVALWREALLAKVVLQGKTSGYKNHPQLIRFKEQDDPVKYINRYLEIIHNESCERAFCFDGRKFRHVGELKQIDETTGQLMYEWDHLMKKLSVRSPELYQKWKNIKSPDPHPLFRIITGEIRDWEKK